MSSSTAMRTMALQKPALMETSRSTTSPWCCCKTPSRTARRSGWLNYRSAVVWRSRRPRRQAGPRCADLATVRALDWTSLLSRNARLGHGAKIQDFLELLALEDLLLDHQLLDGEPTGDGFLGQLGGFRVTDLGSQRGDERRAPLQPVSTLRGVGFDAVHTALRKHPSGIPHDRQRKHDVVSHDRHHHIELELPGLGRKRY